MTITNNSTGKSEGCAFTLLHVCVSYMKYASTEIQTYSSVTGDPGCAMDPALMIRKPWIQDFFHGCVRRVWNVLVGVRCTTLIL